jgi:hypothetical protein
MPETTRFERLSIWYRDACAPLMLVAIWAEITRERPRAHAAACTVIAGAVAPQRQEGLLRHVFCERACPAHAVGQREHRVGVALQNDFERVGVVAGGELHQLLIGEPA